MISLSKLCVFLAKWRKPSQNVLPFLKICCFYFSPNCLYFALAVSARQLLFSIGLNCLRLGKTQLFKPSSACFDQLLDVLTKI
jgi:hypothetical protein